MQNNLNPSNANVIAVNRDNRGFTILEVIIAMTIFMMVTGAIWGVLRIALLSRTTVNQQVQLAKNVRLALNVIGKDTYNAGFGYPVNSTVVLPDNRISAAIGIPNDYDTTRDTVPPIIAGNQINLDTYNTTANTRTDQITLLFKDSSFNTASGVSTPLNIFAPTSGTGYSQIVPVSGSNSVCNVNDLYLITGTNGSRLGVATSLVGANSIRFADGDVMGLNLAGSTDSILGITGNAAIQRVKMLTYFVASDGTLTRREFVNVPPVSPAVAYVDEPLVYGVDDFQIQYIMDDGTITDNPSAGPDAVAGTADDIQSNLAAVRQIRYTVSARSTELNSSGQPFRETMTSTFSTRNLGYN